MISWKEYKKKLKEQDQQKKKLLPFKKINFLTKEYVTLQNRKFQKLLTRVHESRHEEKLYRTYLDIVNNSFNRDNFHRKFSLKHVEALGVEWDILFVYGKKDMGKTWAVAKYIEDLLERYPEAQIAFIRNSKEEAKGFINMMNSSEIWPTWTDGEQVWRKKEIQKINYSPARRRNLKPCGIFAYCSGAGFTRWQGGNWDNLKFWYWDECNSVEGGLTHEVFQALNVFLSSMIRDKEGEQRVKGIMTGNLLEKSNIFLERLGVGSKTKLKIFKVHKDNDPKKEILSTMLYLNTGDLFKGIEEQKGLATQFLNEYELEALLSNRPGLKTGKSYYEEADLKNFWPLYAFVFRETEENTATRRGKFIDYILYTYRIPRSGRVVVWIDRFSVMNIKPGFKKIFCNDLKLSNIYPMTVYIEEEEDFGEMFIEPIAEYMKIGEVWFGWNGSLEIFDSVWDSFETRYMQEDTNSI